MPSDTESLAGAVDSRCSPAVAWPASGPPQRGSPGRCLPRPGVFLVGAPRCGTTSLYQALRLNPQVCAARPKETHFFLRPARPESTDQAMRYYARRFFPHLADQHRVMLDGSVSYLYSAEALRRIDRADGHAKFIVMVRNPIDLVHSFYHRLVYLMDENAGSFAEAWGLQAQRLRGERIPRKCRDPRFLIYGEIGRLGRHLEQLFAIVGRERCHVILFDDLVGGADAVHRAALAFIGVDPDDGIAIRSKNGTRTFSSGWLQRFTVNPPRLLGRLVDIDVMMTAGWIKRVRKGLKRRNTRRAARPVLDPALRPMLQAHFAADIDLLSTLLGRDLSHWR